MKLAAGSHRKIEAFFRETLSDEHLKLPAIYFYAGKFSRLLTEVLKIHGITIGRHIFVTPELVSISADKRLKIHAELAAHEIAHVLQYEREGFSKFLCKYLKSYFENLKRKEKWDAVSRQQAYFEIPFEIEARAVAAEFLEWNGKMENGKWKMEN